MNGDWSLKRHARVIVSLLTLGACTAVLLLLCVTSPDSAHISASRELELGESCYYEGNLNGAIRMFREAVRLKPDLWQAHLVLISLCVENHDLDSAIQECRKVLKIRPNKREVMLVLGDLLRTKGDYDSAQETFRKALDAGAHPAMAYNGLGLTLLEKGDLEGAALNIRKALEIKPKFPEARVTLSVVLFKMGDGTNALAEIDRALSDGQDIYAAGHNTKGDMLAAMGKLHEALDEYRMVIRHTPDDAPGWTGIGNAELQLGDLGEADSAYRQALGCAPANLDAMYGLALVLERQGKPDQAIEQYKEALTIETSREIAAQIKEHVGNLRIIIAGRGNRLALEPVADEAASAVAWPPRIGLVNDAAALNPLGRTYNEMFWLETIDQELGG